MNRRPNSIYGSNRRHCESFSQCWQKVGETNVGDSFASQLLFSSSSFVYSSFPSSSFNVPSTFLFSFASQLLFFYHLYQLWIGYFHPNLFLSLDLVVNCKALSPRNNNIIKYKIYHQIDCCLL